MRELTSLYRSALRSGNRPLARLLARALRSDPALRERADRELQRMPRGSGRPSASARRALRSVLRRLGASAG